MVGFWVVIFVDMSLWVSGEYDFVFWWIGGFLIGRLVLIL